MNESIKHEWELDVTEHCPFCGSENIESVETDDGIDDKLHIHWLAFLYECNDCKKSWYLEYALEEPHIYEA